MMMIIWLLTILAYAEAGFKLDLPLRCSAPLDKGNDCGNNNATTRYFMDPERLQCFPFKYKGCGGNANNFKTEGECFRCLPADFQICPGNTDTVKGGQAKSGLCSELMTCPDTSECRMGYMVGLCCSKDSIKKENSDRNPVCPSGKEIVKHDRFGFEMNIEGRSCDDEFCPRGTSCHQGHFIAYCCK